MVEHFVWKQYLISKNSLELEGVPYKLKLSDCDSKIRPYLSVSKKVSNGINK